MAELGAQQHAVMMAATTTPALVTRTSAADARAEGFGQIRPPRLALMASQVSDAFNTKTRVNSDLVWDGSFLPPAAQLNILGGKK